MAGSAKAIGKRLEKMHVALDVTQAEVCRRTGLKPNRYSQYVNGERALTLDAANKIVDKFPVTLDWLIRGDEAGLSVDTYRKIERAA